MSIQLRALTPSGADLVALAEQLACELAAAAPEHDRDGSYPFAGIGALQRARYFAAPVPAELGGLGVESLHDLVVASSRLARGDAAVAIGVNMHMAVLGNIVRRWRDATALGDVRRASAFGETLTEVVDEGTIIATAVSEPGQDLTHPVTSRDADGVRLARGRREDLLHDVAGGDGPVHDRLVHGRRRRGALRLRPHPGVGARRDDPRRLGRARHARLGQPLGDVRRGRAARVGAARRLPRRQPRRLPGGQPHGRALPRRRVGRHRRVRARDRDAPARRSSSSTCGRRCSSPRGRSPSAPRGRASRAPRCVAEAHVDTGEGELEDVFAEVQGAKTFINETAVQIVDGALALTGGAGYRSTHPISRLYRDVRAGAFMHPLGANRAYEFVGRVALGHEAPVH